MDGLQGVHEKVRVRLPERLMGAPAGYLPTTDKDQARMSLLGYRNEGRGKVSVYW